MNYNFLRSAMHVKRFHTVPFTAMPESVGHHTCQVLVVLLYLFKGSIPPVVTRLALEHDVPELVTGDIPAPTKWSFPKFVEALTDVEAKVVTDYDLITTDNQLWIDMLAYADQIDLAVKCLEEISGGNMQYMVIMQRVMPSLRKMIEGPLKDHPEANALFQHLFPQEYENEELSS